MVLGFGGSSTVPVVAMSALSRFISKRLTDNCNPYMAMNTSIVTDVGNLKGAPVVWLCLEKGVVRATALVFHSPPEMAYGMELPACGGMVEGVACQAARHNVEWQSDAPWNRARVKCKICGWRSGWGHVAGKERNLHFIHAWGPSHPRIFEQDFPLTQEQLNIFHTFPLNGAPKGRKRAHTEMLGVAS